MACHGVKLPFFTRGPMSLHCLAVCNPTLKVRILCTGKMKWFPTRSAHWKIWHMRSVQKLCPAASTELCPVSNKKFRLDTILGQFWNNSHNILYVNLFQLCASSLPLQSWELFSAPWRPHCLWQHRLHQRKRHSQNRSFPEHIAPIWGCNRRGSNQWATSGASPPSCRWRFWTLLWKCYYYSHCLTRIDKPTCAQGGRYLKVVFTAAFSNSTRGLPASVNSISINLTNKNRALSIEGQPLWTQFQKP